MSGADRQARTRRRRKAGLRCYRIELPEVPTEQMLIRTNFLREIDADDPAKVEAALRDMVTMLGAEDA